MKLHFRLWIVFSLISFVGLATLYLLIVNIYSERVLDNQKQVSFSQGHAISARVAGLIPTFMDRAEGYLDYYSERFDTRLLLLSADKRLTYDSFGEFPLNERVALKIVESDDALPASLFVRTNTFGFVQYTLLPIDHSDGYLLMVGDANFVATDVRKFRNQVLMYLAPATLGSWLAFYFIAAWFTRPIRQVIWHLKQVTPQRRKFPMRVKGNNEIGQLVTEIKLMIDQLNVYEYRQRQFMSTSSHELKTPLATMQLISENLPSLRADGMMHAEYVKDLQLQIDKMRAKVQGMLDVYRQTDKPLDQREVTFSEIQNHVTKQFQHIANDKNIRLAFVRSEPSLYVDEELFFTGLDNLLSNAVHYSRLEQSTIEISLFQGSSGQVVCRVCDEGLGIAEEDLPHIFEPFYRSNEVTGHHQDGSGLGLVIVKQMVDLHGGEIEVTSTVGKGSCFSLKFERNKSVT